MTDGRRMLGVALISMFAAGCDSSGGGTDLDSETDAGEDSMDTTTEEVEPVTLTETLRIQGGAVIDIQLQTMTSGANITVPEMTDPMSDLDLAALAAVNAAPEWIREDLAWKLWELDDDDASTVAAQITGAEELHVDEVAWSIAVTPSAILEWMVDSGWVAVFGINAQDIYAVDGQLDYARLVELEDGRTTLEYEGEAGTEMLATEQYYWWVVYPRGYFELPQIYDGQWWRSLFRLTTPTAPSIVTSVASATSVQDAAHAVGEWIQEFMVFMYGTNELQPVEIYQERHGSCGQYSIITTAAARTVLIPTASVSARADDHEWNEFWDGRWVMWDNSLGEMDGNPQYPYIDMPEIFDRDSGGSEVLGEVTHVFRFRPDDHIIACEQYTDKAEVTLTVIDGAGSPVEGARVVARSGEASYWPCTWQHSDHTGVVSFLLGDDLPYGFTTTHPLLGDWPALSVDPRVSTIGTDPISETIEYTATPARRFTDAGEPPGGDATLTVSFDVVSTIQMHTNVITEDYDMGIAHPFTLDDGVIDLYLLDATNHQARIDGLNYEAYSVRLASTSEVLTVELPSDEEYWIVLDNDLSPTSTRIVDLTITVE